jgi:GNAT superfamily N-acetyltransferase
VIVAGPTNNRFVTDIGDFDAVGPEIHAFWLRQIKGFSDEHFDKYYRRNPLGRPTFVVARDDAGALVGAAALHPTEMLVAGDVRRGAVAGDFAVAEQLRGLGPAVALQRRLLEHAADSNLEFSFGLPNAAARAVLRRVGYRDLGRFERLVRRLGTRERIVGLARRPPRLKGLTIESLPRFDDRFEDVWAAAAQRARYAPARSVAGLNWRFELDREEPSRFSVTAAVSSGVVRAYAVSGTAYGMCRIFELGWLEDESLGAVMRAELNAAAAARLAGVDLLHLGRNDALAAALAPLGFVAGDSAPAVVYAGRTAEAALFDPKEWELFEGSVDV